MCAVVPVVAVISSVADGAPFVIAEHTGTSTCCWVGEPVNCKW